eukprot:CAMPEP_0180524734 /NCGR_PEP_ID=MMETSP1036_2-20121128/58782_1 /TAXON_ID=632150 /ORGANISM="Azadinium spinosum, Strain 3D9" /LENGTH=57 /DNA_ID=CAMNT_0022537965 /DNA_START=514 /DNA_END=683 /DNA_ORIENTATION=-
MLTASPLAKAETAVDRYKQQRKDLKAVHQDHLSSPGGEAREVSADARGERGPEKAQR